MALYRSKLGPVGGSGDGDRQDGGIIVDLDPLSAFALMGRSSADEASPITSPGELRSPPAVEGPAVAGSAAIAERTRVLEPVGAAVGLGKAAASSLGSGGEIGGLAMNRRRGVSNGNVPTQVFMCVCVCYNFLTRGRHVASHHRPSAHTSCKPAWCAVQLVQRWRKL